MAKTAIGYGLALILLALVGYFGASGPQTATTSPDAASASGAASSVSAAAADGTTDAPAKPYRSWTALIPAFAGVPIALCGLISLNPAMRKHAMHVAVIFGLLGFIAPLGRLIPSLIKGNVPRPLVLASQAGMALLCLAFMILCIRSFIAARRARRLGGSAVG